MGMLTRALRDICRGRMRTVLVVLALSFSVAVFASVVIGIDASRSKAKELAESYEQHTQSMMEEANRTLLEIYVTKKTWFPRPGETEQPWRTGKIVSVMDEKVASEIASMEGVEAVVPYLRKAFGETEEVVINESGRFGIMMRMRIDYIVWGVPLDPVLDERYHVMPAKIIEGRKLKEGDQNAVLIGLNLTHRFGAWVGDTVELGGVKFHVVGVYAGIMEERVFMSIRDAQRVLEMDGKVSGLVVHAEDLAAVDTIAAQIKSRYPDLDVNTYRERETSSVEYEQQQSRDMLERLEADLHMIESTGNREIFISSLAAGLVVFFVMFWTVRERTREIGILKAVGFSNRDVMSQFIVEGVLIGIVGGFVGVGVASVAAPKLADLLLPKQTLVHVPATLGPRLALIVIGAAALLSAVGSLYPAWAASRVRPAEALRHG